MTAPRDFIEALLHEHDLEDRFPEGAVREAAAHVAAPGLEDPALEDLERLAFCTIDETTSRDLDQALYVEAHGEGFVAWYAIADAGHYVPLGSALFAEALRRGATAYLPGRNVPMLPRSLSEGIVSLNPGEPRRAVVWRMEVGPDGRCVRTTLHRARIRSRAKLAYDGVQAWLDGSPPPCDDPEVLASLAQLPGFGRLRMRVAEERGVVRYRRRELSVTAGDDGLRFVAHADDRNDVERYNEQLSLLCNVEGARLLHTHASERGDLLQPIYRVHEPPEGDLVERLQAQLRAIRALHGLSPDAWHWAPTSDESLAEFLDGLPHDGREGRIAHAVHRQAVMMNRAAVYRAAPGPHHGVGAPVYGRFSAPMREVVGVFLHQELDELRTGHAQPIPPPFRSADAVRTAVIDAATRSRQRQRDLDRQINRRALDHLFEAAPVALRCTVMGVSRGRVHVQLDAPPIDAKVYFRHLAERHGPLTVAEHGVAALKEDGTPLVVIGQPARLRVLGRDGASDRWALDLLPDPAP